MHPWHQWGVMPWFHNHLGWSYKQHVTLARWFATVTPLAVRRHAVPFPERICPFCSLAVVQTEQHVVLACPGVAALRTTASTLDWSPHELQVFLRINWHRPQLFQ